MGQRRAAQAWDGSSGRWQLLHHSCASVLPVRARTHQPGFCPHNTHPNTHTNAGPPSTSRTPTSLAVDPPPAAVATHLRATKATRTTPHSTTSSTQNTTARLAAPGLLFAPIRPRVPLSRISSSRWSEMVHTLSASAFRCGCCCWRLCWCLV